MKNAFPLGLALVMISCAAAHAQGPRDVNKARWMEELAPRIGKKKLRDIVLPGTHDSATKEITTRKKWTVTTTRSISEQLNEGIRAFDLRVCSRSGQNYVCHNGNLGRPLEEVFDDFRQFLERTRGEILYVVVIEPHDDKFPDWGTVLKNAETCLNLEKFAYRRLLDDQGKSQNNPFDKTYDEIVGTGDQRQSRIIFAAWKDRGSNLMWGWEMVPDEKNSKVFGYYSNTDDWNKMIQSQQQRQTKAGEKPFALWLTLTPRLYRHPFNSKDVADLYEHRLDGEKIHDVMKASFQPAPLSIIYTDFYERTALVEFAIGRTLADLPTPQE